MIEIDLKDRTAVVTGASGELGRVISRTLAEAGASVALQYYKNKDKAHAVKQDIERAGGRAMSLQADVCERESVFAMRDEIREAWGPADIIVNCAVVQYDWTSILEQAEEDFESQFRSCVMHNVLMTKAFVPDMIEKKWGRVIGINTECAMTCSPHQAAYISGKAGQDRVLRVLAREVGKYSITVNQVAPGFMISDKYRKEPIDDSGYIEGVPLGHRGEDQDIANAVAFLASDLARFITGVYLPVSGGTVMPAI